MTRRPQPPYDSTEMNTLFRLFLAGLLVAAAVPAAPAQSVDRQSGAFCRPNASIDGPHSDRCCRKTEATPDCCCKHDATPAEGTAPPGRDCGSCPCCAGTSVVLVYLPTVRRPTHGAAPAELLTLDSDRLESRSDRPLLPPPIV
ncbi:MAG: hypothetical protein AB7U20_16780 [Planctomycetaceae bacterium]